MYMDETPEHSVCKICSVKFHPEVRLYPNISIILNRQNFCFLQQWKNFILKFWVKKEVT